MFAHAHTDTDSRKYANIVYTHCTVCPLFCFVRFLLRFGHNDVVQYADEIGRGVHIVQRLRLHSIECRHSHSWILDHSSNSCDFFTLMYSTDVLSSHHTIKHRRDFYVEFYLIRLDRFDMHAHTVRVNLNEFVD